MITVTKVIGECVSSQKLEIIIPNSLPQKETDKFLLLIERNEDELIKIKTFYFEKICNIR